MCYPFTTGTIYYNQHKIQFDLADEGDGYYFVCAMRVDKDWYDAEQDNIVVWLGDVIISPDNWEAVNRRILFQL